MNLTNTRPNTITNRSTIKYVINTLSPVNLRLLIPVLFQTNLILHSNEFIKDLIQSQKCFPAFSNVYSALVAVVNSRIPSIGERLIASILISIKRAKRRNSRNDLLSGVIFLSHLTMQCVVDESVIYQFLVSLLKEPTDDSIDIAASIITECGFYLLSETEKSFNTILGRIRMFLQNPMVSKGLSQRSKIQLTSILEHRRKGYKQPDKSLFIIPVDEQFTHEISFLLEMKELKKIANPVTPLTDITPEEHQRQWNIIQNHILSSIEDYSSILNHLPEVSDQRVDAVLNIVGDQILTPSSGSDSGSKIISLEDSQKLSKDIRMNLNSSQTADEASHKLMNLSFNSAHQKKILAETLISECLKRVQYSPFYSTIASKFTVLSRDYNDIFLDIFREWYSKAGDVDSSESILPHQLQHIGEFFGELLAKDAISWDLFSCIKFVREISTVPERVIIKYLFQQIKEKMGAKLTIERISRIKSGAGAGMFPDQNADGFAAALWRSLKLQKVADAHFVQSQAENSEDEDSSEDEYEAE